MESNDRQASDMRSHPHWQLVERILLTGPFQKSPNLHALLSYLAEYSILGRIDLLTERQIGVAVFGKPAGYSPAEDSAVRVHVRQLRLRLHEYFDQEGRHEIERVDIPKGSYALEFQNGEPEAQPPPPIAPAAPRESKTAGRVAVREMLFWPALVVAVVCAFGWFHAFRSAAPVPVPWPLNAVIQPDRQTRVVVSDSSTMLRQLGDHKITLEEYLRPGFRESLIPPRLAAADLFRGMADEIRHGGPEAGVFVAPAEYPVALRGIVAQRTTAEAQIADVLRSVDQQNAGRKPRHGAGANGRAANQ